MEKKEAEPGAEVAAHTVQVKPSVVHLQIYCLLCVSTETKLSFFLSQSLHRLWFLSYFRDVEYSRANTIFIGNSSFTKRKHAHSRVREKPQMLVASKNHLDSHLKDSSAYSSK